MKLRWVYEHFNEGEIAYPITSCDDGERVSDPQSASVALSILKVYSVEDLQ